MMQHELGNPPPQPAPAPCPQPVINVAPSPVPVTVQPAEVKVIHEPNTDVAVAIWWLTGAFLLWAVCNTLKELTGGKCCRGD